MTVGEDVANEWVGYTRVVDNLAIGELTPSPPSFRFNGADYTVEEILRDEDGGFISMALSGTLTDADGESLILYVGIKAFRFSERGAFNDLTNSRVWNTSVDWPVGSTVPVRITIPGERRLVVGSSLLRAEVRGNKLVLRYPDYLQPTRSGAGAPLPEAYTVMVDGNRVHVTSTRINTRFVTLMLARAVSHRAANVTVSYDNRLLNAVRESRYQPIFKPSFSNFSVRNITQPSATTPGTGGAAGAQLLYGLMTVGDDIVEGLVGYNRETMRTAIGELSRTGFRFNDTDYTFETITLEESAGQITLNLSGTLTQADAARLVLYVGGTAFRFDSTISFDADSNARTSSAPDLTLPVGGTVPVLLVDTNRPPGFGARGYRLNMFENPERVEVGTVGATDPDNDAVTHSLEGRDGHMFEIDPATGQITTKPGVTYDHEAQGPCVAAIGQGKGHPTGGNCLNVTVKATDSMGASAAADVNIFLTNRVEKDIRDFRVEAPAGTAGTLRLKWVRHSGSDRPDGYEISYGLSSETTRRVIRVGMDAVNVGDADAALPLLYLELDSEYAVRVRARYSSGDGPWSGWVRARAGAAQGGKPRVSLKLPEGGRIARVRVGDELRYRMVVSELTDSHAWQGAVGMRVCHNERWRNREGLGNVYASPLDCRAHVGGLGIPLRTRGFKVTSATGGYLDVSKTVTSAVLASGPLTVTLGPSSDYRLGSVTELCVEFENSSGMVQHPCADKGPLLLRSLVVPADGNSVKLTFNRPLHTNIAPVAVDYTVTVGGAKIQVNSTRLSSDRRTLELPVTPTIRRNRQVRLGYMPETSGATLQDTSGNVLQDADGNDVNEFNLKATNNSTVRPSDSGVGPAPVGALVWPGGTQLTVFFDERIGFLGGATLGRQHGRRFTVNVDGVRVTPADNVDDPEDSRVVLFLYSAIKTGQTVTLSYADPSGNDAAERVIEDRAGNEAPSFTDYPVNNGSRVGLSMFGSAVVASDGQTVQVNFNEPLNRNIPGTDAFTVTVNGVEATIGTPSVSADGRTLELTVSPIIRSGRTVAITYTKPASGNVLESASGAEVVDFSRTATNNSGHDASDPGVGPAPISAGTATSGTSLEMLFDENLKYISTSQNPAGSLFTIKVGGVPVAVEDFVVISGTTDKWLELTLSPAIAQGQKVTVSYRDPSGDDDGRVLEDTDGNDAPSFTDFPVNNISTVPPAQSAPPEPLTAAFETVPASHGGNAFTVRLAFSEEFPVEADTVRGALAVTGGSITTVAQSESGKNRNWQITVTPTDRPTAVTLALVPKESCTDAGAICTADNRGIAEAIGAEIAGVPPTVVTGVAITNGPGENGTWDTGETVEAEVRFSGAGRELRSSGRRTDPRHPARRHAPRGGVHGRARGNRHLPVPLHRDRGGRRGPESQGGAERPHAGQLYPDRQHRRGGGPLLLHRALRHARGTRR